MVNGAFRAVAFVTGLFSALAAIPAHAQSFGDLLRSTHGTPTGSFGAMAIAVMPQSGLSVAPQWRGVLARMQRDRFVLERCIRNPGVCETSQQGAWARMVRQARGMDRGSQLALVNSYFNQFPYRTDQELYGRSEYWASPVEFLANSGDCEDYAIAKYFTLRELGFRSDDLKVVVVTNTARGTGHAVLTASIGGTRMMLDNLNAQVVPEASQPYYTALASMNENGIWVDIPRAGRPGFDRVASLQ